MIDSLPISSRDLVSPHDAAPAQQQPACGIDRSMAWETPDFESLLASAAAKSAPDETAQPTAHPPRTRQYEEDERGAEGTPRHAHTVPQEGNEAQELPGVEEGSTRKSDPPSRPVPRTPDALLKGPFKVRGHESPPGEEPGCQPGIEQPVDRDSAVAVIHAALDPDGGASPPPAHPLPVAPPESAQSPEGRPDIAPGIESPTIRRAAPTPSSRTTGWDGQAKIVHPQTVTPEGPTNQVAAADTEETRSMDRTEPAAKSQPASPQTSPAASPAPAQTSTVSAATFLDLQPQSGERVAAPAPSALPSPGSPSVPTGTGHTQAPLSASPLHSLSEDAAAAQAVRGALALTRSTGGAMTIRLEPESLGSLRIQMHVAQGRVSVQFHAETAQARGLLTNHIDALRTAMETQGLKLETVQIHSLHRAGSTGGAHEQPNSQHQPSSGEQGSRHDSAGQQSRGHGDTAEREAQYRQMARQALHHGRGGDSWRQHFDAASVNAPADPARPQEAHARAASLN